MWIWQDRHCSQMSQQLLIEAAGTMEVEAKAASCLHVRMNRQCPHHERFEGRSLTRIELLVIVCLPLSISVARRSMTVDVASI